MVKKAGATAPSITPDEHIKDIEKRLREMGVIDISITFAPGIQGQPCSEVKKSTAEFFEAFLAGKLKPLDLAELDVKAKRKYVRKEKPVVAKNAWPFANPKPVGLADGKVALDDDRVSVQVLSGVGAEAYTPKKTTYKRVSKKTPTPVEEPTGTAALLKPDSGWPFPNAKRKPEEAPF